MIHYPVFGGPHNRNIRIAPSLRAAGVDVAVLLPDEPGDAADRIRDAGVEVITLPLHRVRASRRPSPHLRLAARFAPEVGAIRRTISEGGFDAVLINGLVNPHAAVAGRLEGIGVVWQLLDTLPPMPLRRALMPLVANLADVVMSTGVEVARVHPGALRLDERLVYFFPPVDVDAFVSTAAKRAAARAELGLAASDFVIGNVSNLTPMKGHRTFIRAAAELRRRRPDVRFVILGAAYAHRDGYTNLLFHEAQSLGLELNRTIIFRNPGSRVSSLAPAFDVFWLTSERRSEGVPTALGEAMALELPVVATNVGSVREAVVDGLTGTVVPPRDPHAIAHATLPYLDDERRRAAGVAGRRRAEEFFSVEACATAHLRALDSAIERAGRRSSAVSRRC